ncbi:MAG: hypothetical protein ACRDJH_00710, partial [Thermomicrobiales bacterium]
MNRPDRSSIVVLAVVLAALLPAAALVALHLDAPSDGAILGEGQQAWTRDGVIVTVLDERPGGLRDGDLVVAVNGRSLEAWAGNLFHPGRWHAELRRGETATYTVERAGRRLDLTIEPGSYPLGSVLVRN